MNERNARIVAGILGVLAGLLQIYNATIGRDAGEAVAMGDVSMGIFWLALGVYFFSGIGKSRGVDKRDLG